MITGVHLLLARFARSYCYEFLKNVLPDVRDCLFTLDDGTSVYIEIVALGDVLWAAEYLYHRGDGNATNSYGIVVQHGR